MYFVVLPFLDSCRMSSTFCWRSCQSCNCNHTGLYQTRQSHRTVSACGFGLQNVIGPCPVYRRDAATGEVRIGIFTTRPVSELEELTYDYMFEHSGVGALAHGFRCMCGSKNCR